MPRFVDVEKIEPGDALLFATRKLSAYLIRIATLSRFHHAAIAISPLVWFESVPAGIDYRVARAQIVWDGKAWRIGVALAGAERISVRRLRRSFFAGDDAQARHRFARSLIAEASGFAFLNYALSKEFLGLLKLSLGNTAIARYLADSMDRKRSAKHAGPFCSWLVALLYERLGAPLSDSPTNRWSPGALARSSKFNSVAVEFVGEARKLPTRLEHFDLQLKQMASMAETTRATATSSASLSKGLDSFNDQIKGLSATVERITGSADQTAHDQLAAIGRRIQKDLEQAREMSARSVENTYYYSSMLLAAAPFLNTCNAGCAEPILAKHADTYCDMRGCHFVAKAIGSADLDLKSVFPRQDLPDLSEFL